MTAFLASSAAAQTARRHHTTTLLPDGNILIVGGANAADTPLNSVQIIYSTGPFFTTATPLTVARASHTATLLADGRVLVAGGCTGTPCINAITNTAEVYDPRTNLWAASGALGTARFNHTATLLPTGNVLIVGGQTSAVGAVTAVCEIYSPAANNFTAVPCSNTNFGPARAGHTATLLHTGRVFIAGGYTASGFSVATTLYDPVGNTWLSGPTLIQQRAYHTATQMGHQKVLIAGGVNGRNIEENFGIMQTVEIYDPTSNSIAPATPMQARRSFHSASLLPDGRVAVFGGLANVTTSFFNTNLPFQEGSILALTSSPGIDGIGFQTPVGSTLTLDISDIPLSVAENGRIIDGEIFFSSPNINTDFGNLHFPWSNGSPASLIGETRATLVGRSVNHLTDGGLQGSTNVSWAPASNAITVFTPLDLVPAETPTPTVTAAGGGTFGLNPGSAPPGGTAEVTAGQITVNNVQLRVPDQAVPGSNVRGSLQFLPGTTIDATEAVSPNLPFTISLTTGATQPLSFTASVSENADGEKFITLNGLVFSGLRGEVLNSSDTANLTAAGIEQTLNGSPRALFSSGQVRLRYMLERIDMTNVPFSIDIATIVIREMASGSFEEYDPSENSWSFSPFANAGGRIGATSLVTPQQSFLNFSGFTCANEASCGIKSWTVLSGGIGIIAQPVWANGTPLVRARSNHSATELPDGDILIAGGNNGTDVVAVGELYDPTAELIQDRWTDTLPMRLPRSHHTATLLPNGTILFAGGFTTGASTGATSRAEIYYPDTKSFTETAPMISSRSFHAAMVLPDGNVLVAGGFTNGAYLDSAEIYYSTMHVWAPINAMDTERAEFAASLLQDGRVLVTGGVNGSGILGDSAVSGSRGHEIYNPNTGLWSAAAAANDARRSHTATVLRDGRVLLAGGNDGFGEIGRAEIYEPRDNTWTRVTAVGAGGDMVIPRLDHTATLLPTNRVLITGGFTALRGAIGVAEMFNPGSSSFSAVGVMTNPRGEHTTTLLADGNLIAVGGSDGAQAGNTVEIIPMGYNPDSATPASGLRRRPEITGADAANTLPGRRLTLLGNNFKGRTEASSGGTNASSHSHPRLVVQRLGGSGIASSNDAGFSLDLSSGVMHNQLTPWSVINTSMTVALPSTAGEFPLGWYSFRVAANGQYSDSRFIQVAPNKPTATPGTPVGQLVGISSISWSWAAAPGGGFDGYNIYSATSGVFIGTAAPSGGATENFIQRNLGPDTSALIKVAAYTLGGDGPVITATGTVLTSDSGISNITGSAQTTQSIFWSWPPVQNAINYKVLSASDTTLIATAPTFNFTQVGLSTNSENGIRVQAQMPSGSGQISNAATAYTLAASPLPENPPVTNVSTGGFTTRWNANTNPPGTDYQFRFLRQPETDFVTVETTELLNASLGSQEPNLRFQLEVQAINGDGIGTGFISLGSTVTHAAPPTSPSIALNTATELLLTWNPNGNHELTEYQVLFSSDNFVNHFATRTTFGDGFFATQASFTNLITGQAYFFRVSALDQFGRESAQVSTQTVTDNGGGPVGSLAFEVPRVGLTVAGGTLGGGNRSVGFRVPANTFESNTRIFVSTETTLNCGNINAAINVVPVPAVQPQAGFEMSIEYFPGEPNLGPLATLGIVRWDPLSNTCVPLVSSVDQASRRVTAQVNHLSQFQLMQLSPSSSVSNARVFPNPLYKSRQGFFTIDRLPANTRIRIYTITGGLVFEGNANASGVARWDATNTTGRPVGSGIYIAVIENGGSREKLKLVVLR